MPLLTMIIIRSLLYHVVRNKRLMMITAALVKSDKVDIVWIHVRKQQSCKRETFIIMVLWDIIYVVVKRLMLWLLGTALVHNHTFVKWIFILIIKLVQRAQSERNMKARGYSSCSSMLGWIYARVSLERRVRASHLIERKVELWYFWEIISDTNSGLRAERWNFIFHLHFNLVWRSKLSDVTQVIIIERF